MAKFSRRDIVHGLATLPLAGASMSASGASAQKSAYYPPGEVGLRGSHVGSFETAHALAREGRTDFGPAAKQSEEYDLVVVGAGVSGLAAAYYYRQAKPDARILILDNHDDFGGHAKRNEFTVDGRHLIGYGGSQTMEAPSAYSDVCKQLLADLQVSVDDFETHYDQEFFKRHGLSGGLFFDKETYGQSAFVATPGLGTGDFLGLAPGKLDLRESIDQMPLSAADRNLLYKLFDESGDAVPEVGLTDLPDYLQSISYQAFLQDRLHVDSEVLINLLRTLPSGYFGIGIDGITALEALAMGMPGINQLGVVGVEFLRGLLGGLVEPYIHHFPDGNASIARLLVRSLIPAISREHKPADLVGVHFDYSLLDRPENNMSIRLSSTAVNVAKQGAGVRVSYVTAGQQYQVKGKHCVMACYNMMIPHICPGLPGPQKQALAEQVKVPLVYTNVVLRQWHALKNLGVGQAFSPNMFHQMMMVDFPVSMGATKYARGPDDPIILHMSSAFGAPGLEPKDQFRIGRARLLGTAFQDIETDIRNHLQQMLGPGGFENTRDIAAITVNRWPHGYAYGGYDLFDPEYPPGQAPHELGRATWGPIAIANSDAGGRAYLDEAIDQAYRAVNELI